MLADIAAFETREQRWCDLMHAAQAGDSDAYHRLLSELSDVIERYLRRHFGRLPFEEDCIQDTLMNLHKARHTWSHKRAFGPWLFTIVRHTAIDAIRHSSRYHDALSAYADHQALDRIDACHSDAPEIGELLARLSDSQREILTLIKINGFTAREAGQRLGISTTAAKVRCHRAIAALRNQAATQSALTALGETPRSSNQDSTQVVVT